MGPAVVGEGAACGGDDDLLGRVGHRDGAQLLGHDLVVTGLGSAVEGELVGVLGAADLGLGTDGLEAIGLALDDALDRAVGHGVGGAVVDEGVGAGRDGQRGGRDLIGTGDGAGVVAFAGDGHGYGAGDVGEVVGAVGDRVVGALGKRLLTVGHGRRPLMGLAIVDDVLGRVDAHAVLVGGRDVLGLDRELAEAGLDAEVAGGEAVLPAVGDRVRDLALGNGSHPTGSLEVVDLALEELGRAGDAHRGVALRLASVGELTRVGAEGDRGGRDLIGTRHRSGVVALAGDGHGDGAGDVGEVVGSVGHVVVGALDELAAGLVGDGRDPLVLVAVVDDVARAVDLDAVIGAGGRVVRVDGLGGHREGAVNLADLVVVQVGVLPGLNHVSVRRAAHGGLLAAEVVGKALAIDKRALGHISLVLGKRRAVINLGVARRGNGHGTPGDLKGRLAGGNVTELVGHVLACGVLDGIGVDFRGGVADISDGALGRGLERIAGGQPVRGHARARELGAVIRLAGALGHYDDASRALGDLEGAELLGDGIVGLLGVVVPVDGIGIGARANGGLGAGHGERRGLAVDKAGDLALGGESGAVVLLARAARRHVERGGRDLDRAGLLGDVEIIRDVLALRVDDDELVDVSGNNLPIGHIGCCRVGVSRLDRVALGQAGHGDVDAVRLAVIDAAVVTGSGNDDIGGLGNGEGTEPLADGVVGLLGSSGPIDGVGVGAGADLGLGAGRPEVGGLAVDETGDVAPCGERLAVVDLRAGRGPHVQRSRSDLVLHFDAACIVALAGHGHGHGPGIGLVGREGEVIVDTLLKGLRAVLDLRLLGLLGAVVRDVRKRADRHLVVLVVWIGDDALCRDGQDAVVLGDDLIIALGRGAPLDAGDLVVGGADLGLGAPGLGGRGLAVDKALDGAAGGQGRSVIDLGHALCVHGKRCRGDLVRLRRGPGVVPDALDGDGDGLHISEVVRVVGDRIVSALGKRSAAGILDLGSPLVLHAVIDGIGGVADANALIAVRVLRVGHDGLSGHLKGAKALAHNVIVVGRAVLQLIRNGVVALADLGLGAGSVDLPIACEIGPNETGARTVRAHVDPILSEGGAVVDFGRTCGSQLDVALINSESLFGVLVTAVVISRGANLNRHRTSINRRNLRHVAAPFGVGRALNAVFNAHISASDRSARACRTSRMRLGVVSVFGVVGRDDQTILCRKRGDGELALFLGDVVVARLEVDALVVNDGIGNLALGNRGHGAGSANVGDFAFDKAVARHSDIRPGKSGAVVRLGVCRTFENHRALEDLVFHVGAAGVVALTGHGNGNGADVSSVLAVRKRIVNVLRQSLIPVLNDGLLLLRLAVVRDVRRSLHRHVLAGLDALGRDVQLTIDNHERNIGEVLVVVGEVARLELHVVGADVCTLDSVVAAEDEVSFLIQIVGSLEVIARDRLLGAIVLNVTAVLGNSDDDLVLVSGHNEFAALGGNPVVGLAGALIEGIGEGVIAFALLGLGTSNVKGNALAVDKANTFTLGGCGDGAVGKRSSVIRLVAALGSQRHKTLGDRDALEAGGVLALCIVGASGAQLHVLATKMGNRDLGRIPRPCLAINAVFDIQGIAMLIGRGRGVGGKRCAVIDLLIVVRVPRNTLLVDFAALNLEPAVLNHELDVGEVLIDVGELLLGKVHIVAANSDTLSSRMARELKVALSVEAVIDREVIAGHELRGAVVGLSVLLALDGDGDLIGNGANMQITRGHLGDDIVLVGAHLAHGAVGKRVGIVTSIGTLAAVERNAVEESDRSFAQISRVPVDALLRAVIGLGVGVRSKRHVLVVVELDNVFVFIARKREAFRIGVHRGIAAERFGRNVADGIAALVVSIVGFKRLIGTVPVVFNFVFNGIRLVVEINRSISTHDAHLGFARYRSVSGNSNRLLRDRLPLHVSGKGLRRGNRLRRSLEIIVHLD